MGFSDPELILILECLGSADSAEAERAWSAFVEVYSALLYGVVRAIAREDDHVADCFLFVCQKLSTNAYRRLRQFKPNGRARFTTWLTAVCRNLALDWHRSQFGRRRVFGVIAKTESLDQEIFRVVLQRKSSVYEGWQLLSKSFPGLTYTDLESRVEKLSKLLSSRQIWLLSTSQHPVQNSLERDSYADSVADKAPNPEDIVLLEQTLQQVSAAMTLLPDSDRLLLRLRYEEELGLREIAALVGFKDPQTADRGIKEALSRLREKLLCDRPLSGKQKSASV